MVLLAACPACCCTLLARRGRWGLAPAQLLVGYVFTAAAYRHTVEPRACAVLPRRRAKGGYVRHCHTDSPLKGEAALLDYSEAAREDCASMVVVPGFVSAEEERSLMQEIGRTLRGKRYLYDHWDGAIEGYRETEKALWSAENMAVVQRLKRVASHAVENRQLSVLEEVHVLDLAKDGFIKPHIDSVKFCGDVIAGISLLSPSVMLLSHEEDSGRWIRALLPHLSLYIMRGPVRYHYTHAILPGEKSEFKGQRVERERRVSVICRTHPDRDSGTTGYRGSLTRDSGTTGYAKDGMRC